MNDPIGKWKQSLLLKQNRLTAKRIPETKKYSDENLLDFLSRYDCVYIKHDTSGQGRGVFKVYVTNDGKYCLNGFSLTGKPIKQCVDTIEDFHKNLRRFKKPGKLGNYIIQEGIQSYNGQPTSIRVHVQHLKGKWIIGGMIAKIGTPATNDSGILNFSRGAQVISIEELLSIHLKMDDIKMKKVIDDIEKITILVTKVIALHYPNREFGIDFGINPQGKPILYEVNTNPGIAAFYKLENKATWRQIMKIRKLQKRATLRKQSKWATSKQIV